MPKLTRGLILGALILIPSLLGVDRVSAAGTGVDLPATSNTGAAKPVTQIQSPNRLILPTCTQSGNCSLDDIVQTGVNFATFIMGLSGALFFAIFIYGGALYLTSFGAKDRVEKGKKMIKGAAIGIVLVMGAWTIVRTIVRGVGANVPGVSGGAGGGSAADKCAAQGDGWKCQELNGKTSQDAMADGKTKGLDCKTGLCPGAANILCCK